VRRAKEHVHWTLIKGEMMIMKARKMDKRFGIKDRHTQESTKQFKEITP
jgi:hypothetical protein